MPTTALPEDLADFPFLRPPEMSGESTIHEVVIVGAGPVGLTLALTLTQAGVPVVVLEDDQRVCTGSRALGMSRRTLEIWDALGAVSAIKVHGRPWSGGRSFYRGRTILEFAMANDPSLCHPPMFNIQQCYTEHYLVDALVARPDADLRWHSRLSKLTPGDDSVSLQVTTPEGNYRMKARYVVACDGARSPVRSLMGLQLEGTSYEANYVIADIELDTDARMERRCWFDPPSNPGLTVLMHGQPDRLWRLDYQLAAGEDAQLAVQPDQVKRRIQQHLDYIGESGAWRLDWVSLYRVHSRALRNFNHGRVLFAGDAAHLMPIFGIRGLNSGVEDAWNLGWKLADVVAGRAGALLLDAYSMERRGVFLENAALANRNALFMTPPNEGVRKLRDAVLSLSLGDTPVQDILNPKQATYVPLRGSPLCTADADADAWAAGPAPGEVLPDVLLASTGVQAHLQGKVRGRHCAICFVGDGSDGTAADALSALDSLAGLDVVVVATAPSDRGDTNAVPDPGGSLHARFDALPGTVYLVRPDHHIVARFRAPTASAVRIALARAVATLPFPGTAQPPDPQLSVGEQIYQCLGNALDDTPAAAQPLLLMKLALRLGLDAGDPVAFAQAVRAARAHLDPEPARDAESAAPSMETLHA